MEQQALIDVLQHHPFLEGFDPKHVEKIAGLAYEARFAKDQIIFREGDQSSLFYLLQSGKVSLEVLALGKVARIQTLGEGDELGWSSIFSGGRKQFQARALGAVRALAFDGAQLQAACEEDPVFGYALLKRLLGVVAERLQATRMQLMDMYSSSGVKV